MAACVMNEGWWIRALLLGAFVGLSFFCSLAEAALFSLTNWQARCLREERSSRARRVVALLGRGDDLLATIVLGNSLAQGGAACLAMWLAFAEGYPPWPTLLGTVGALLIFGEILPKALALRNPAAWAGRVSGLMEALVRASEPARFLAQAVNEQILRRLPKSVNPSQATTPDEEYAELLDLAASSGALESSEKELILRIMELDQRQVHEVMRPRTEMRAVPDDMPLEAMRAAARRHRHRRLPIYDETPDTIVGVLRTWDLLIDQPKDLSAVMDLPGFVPESICLARLLRSLQRQKRGMAIVVDEFGSVAGLVTVADIVQDVLQLESKGPLSGFFVKELGPGRWEAAATMRLDDLRRLHPQLPDVPAVDTVGGLMMLLLGVTPKPGEKCEFAGLRFTALEADERRVKRVLVEQARPARAGG